MPFAFALWLRSRMRPGNTAGIVAFAGLAIGSIVGTIVVSHVKAARYRSHFDHAISSALHAPCSEPLPDAPDLVAMRELMCASGARNARISSNDGTSVGVVVHADLMGTALPHVPAAGNYTLLALDASGVVVNHVAIVPGATFAFARDPRTPTAVRVRLVTGDQPVGESELR